MRVVCSWCEAEGKPAIVREKEPLEDPEETHGVRYRVSRDLFRRRSSWNKALTELRARRRAMNELCMASPSNVAWTGAYLGLRLLPAVLARWVYRYLRPRTTRV